MMQVCAAGGSWLNLGNVCASARFAASRHFDFEATGFRVVTTAPAA